MTNVSCIGCGTVGSAWAVVFAKAGHTVSLFDQNEAGLTNLTIPLIHETLSLLDDASMLTERPEEIIARISIASSLEEAALQANYIQESVTEIITVKRELFSQLSCLAKPDTILASSTSAIKPSEFLVDITGPERALVAHPVNPPSLIPLVELCGSPLTSPEILAFTDNFLSSAGMKPIKLNKEIDGFILNRLQYTMVAEAMHLVGEGYCSVADLDRVITDGLALRWASIGPFTVAHLNAKKGFQGFVDQLGPMMKTMGREAQTDYDWSEKTVKNIHHTLSEKIPVSEITHFQKWRNNQILATRNMQERGKNALKEP